MTGIRVAVADDESLIRDVVSELIRSEPTMELVGTAKGAVEAVRMAEQVHPDVILMDVRMNGGGGTAATRAIRKRNPLVRVVALSAYGDRGTVLEMVRAGAVGYVAKGSLASEILDAIRRAARGQSTLSADVSTVVLGELAGRLEVQEQEESDHRDRAQKIRAVLDDPALIGIVYQPIFDLGSERTVSAEALARFAVEPRRPPDVWFADASRAGLRQELELASMRRALDGLDRMSPETSLSLNVSPSTVDSPAFEELSAVMPARRLVLEITEHAPVEDYDALAARLADFRFRGGRLAVDDAGAGFASLRHIVRLNPDYIKLDISLTRGIDTDLTKRAMAKALISFAKETDIHLVAEGIETRTELEALRALGVSFGQGYLLGKPLPLPLAEGYTP